MIIKTVRLYLPKMMVYRSFIKAHYVYKWIPEWICNDAIPYGQSPTKRYKVDINKRKGTIL